MRSLVLHSDHLGGDVDPGHPLDGVWQTAHDVQHLPSDSGKYFVRENGWNIFEGKIISAYMCWSGWTDQQKWVSFSFYHLESLTTRHSIIADHPCNSLSLVLAVKSQTKMK